MVAIQFFISFYLLAGVTVTRSELISKLAEKNPTLYRSDIEKLVTIILDEMSDALQNGDRVELRGFGAFTIRSKSQRPAHNPRNGTAVSVDEKKVPHFKMARGMLERLNK